jgi:ABC-type transport system substrate-binding protein
MREFRRAVDLALDKKIIYKDVFQDRSPFPSISGPFLPGSGMYNSSVQDYQWADCDYSRQPFAQRQQQARTRIAQIYKLKPGDVAPVLLDFVYLSTNDAGNTNLLIANYVDSLLKDVGLRINTIPLEKHQYYERLQRGDFDLALYEWTSNVNPGLDMWEPREEDEKGIPANAANISGYVYSGRNPGEFAEHVRTIKYGRRDIEEIRRAHHFVHQELHEEVAAVFLWNRNLFIALNSKYKSTVVRDPVHFLKSIVYWRK